MKGLISLDIAVGSQNPPKLRAVKLAFEQVYGGEDIRVHGFSVPSGVRDHPLDRDETIAGAKNRAVAVAGVMPQADYLVGLEGGLEFVADGGSAGGEWFEQCWAVVLDSFGKAGKARSVGMVVPPELVNQFLHGGDLNRAMENLTGQKDIGKREGYVGYASNGVLPRDRSYVPAVVAALVPFLHPELFAGRP